MLSDCQWRGKRLFSGRKFTKVSAGRSGYHSDFFSTQSFLAVTDAKAEMWKGVGRTGGRTDRRTDRMTDTCPGISAAFFFLIQVAKDSYNVTFVLSCNFAPLILPPEADQSWSEISPPTFTQNVAKKEVCSQISKCIWQHGLTVTITNKNTLTLQ